MNKNYFTLTLLLLAFSFTLNAQDEKDQLLSTLADETCQCFEKKSADLKDADESQIELEFGVCLMESYGKHKKEADKLLNISFDDDKSLENLGVEIGIKMATLCPNTLMFFAGNYTDDEETIFTQVTGEFIKIDTKQFNTIYIKDGNGRTLKLLWFGYFEGQDLFLNTKKLDGKILSIEYEEMEIYDPNIEEYRDYKVITKALII